MVWALGNWESPEFLHWVNCKLIVVPWWFWQWAMSQMLLLDWFWWTVCQVMVVIIAFGFGDIAVLDRINGFSISLTLNCLLLACLLLFLLFCFLLGGLLGTGAFCSEGVLGLSG